MKLLKVMKYPLMLLAIVNSLANGIYLPAGICVLILLLWIATDRVEAGREHYVPEDYE